MLPPHTAALHFAIVGRSTQRSRANARFASEARGTAVHNFKPPKNLTPQPGGPFDATRGQRFGQGADVLLEASVPTDDCFE